MKIRTKLFVSFLVFTIVSLGIMTLVSVSLTQKALKKEIAAHLQTAAKDRAQHIETYLKSQIELNSLIASRTVLRERFDAFNKSPDLGKQAGLSSMLRDSLLSSDGMKRISLLNTDGVVVASTDHQHIGKDLSGEVIFHEGMDHSTGIFIPDEGSECFVSASPVIYDNEVIGVEMTVLDPDEFQRIVQDRTGFGETGEVNVAVRRRSAIVLLTPGLFEDNVVRYSGGDTVSFIPMESALQREHKLFENIVDYRNHEVMAVSHYIETGDIGLVAKIDLYEAFKPVQDMTISALGVFTASIVVVLILVWVLSTNVTKPLHELTIIARAISKNNFNNPVRKDLQRSDSEVGILAKAFAVMAARLRKLYSGLEQKVSELEQAKAKSDAIISSVGEGMTVTDRHGAIILANPAFEKLLGWKRSDVIGRKLAKAIPAFDRDKRPIPERDRLITRMKEGAVRDITTAIIHYQTKQGNTIPVMVTIAPIRIEGQIVGTVEVFRDISKEEEIDRAKTEFVSLASHQLRTPLSAIKWYIELLMSSNAGKLGEKQKKYLNEINRGNERMIQLVNELLNVSRLELGTFVVDTVATDIVGLAKTVVNELSPQIADKKLKFNFKYPKSVPIISVDEKLMQIVLQNLLSNAIKYTPGGGRIEFSITYCSAAKEIRFCVCDNGIGIPKQQQRHIFTKFFRADNVRMTDTVGTGLGLYIAKLIIGHSNGTITFKSDEGKGTTFQVAIPIEGMKKKTGAKPLA